MPQCTGCWYAKRATLTTHEPAWTCLHPLSVECGVVGYPLICRDMRSKDAPCGPEGALYRPKCMDGPEARVKFRQ